MNFQKLISFVHTFPRWKVVLGVLNVISTILMFVFFINHELNIGFLPKNHAFILALVQLIIGTYVFLSLNIKWLKNATTILIKRHRVGMAFFIGVASLIAYVYSVVIFITNTINGGSYDDIIFYVPVITLVLATGGDMILDFINFRTSENIDQLLPPLPQVVRRIDKIASIIKFTNVKSKLLHVNDVIYVYKNEIIPIDGEIVSQNSATIDNKIWTGSIFPQVIGKGGKVNAGAINIGEPILIKMTKPINKFNIVKLRELVKERKTSRDILKIQDTFAQALLIIELLFFVLAIVLSLIFHWNFTKSINAIIAIFLIGCPCAIGVTIPLILAITSFKNFKKNILIQNGGIIDYINKVDTVIFDKTGTLTENALEIDKIMFLDDHKSFYQKLMFSLENHSQHVIALAICQRLKTDVSDVFAFKQVNEIPGIGIVGKYNNDTISIISANYAIKNGFHFSKNIDTRIVMAINKRVVGGFNYVLKLRKEAISVINELHRQKKEVFIITGDNEPFNQDILPLVNSDNVYVNVQPAQKAKIIKSLKTEKHKNVLFAGDGINDVLAIKEANVSIGFAAGADISKLESDAMLIDNHLSGIISLFKQFKIARVFIIIIIIWGILFNLIAIPLAAFGLIAAVYAGLLMICNDIVLLLIAGCYRLIKSN